MCISRLWSVSLTWWRSLAGSSQSSDGPCSQSMSAAGISREVTEATTAFSAVVVVLALVSLSARMADGVEFRGMCCMVILQLRNAAIMCMALMSFEADSS